MAIHEQEIKEVFKAGCFSRQSKVVPLLPFSACTMWRFCKEGSFPKPRKLRAQQRLLRDALAARPDLRHPLTAALQTLNGIIGQLCEDTAALSLASLRGF